ncbi:Uncharacterised protein [Xylophilus ampelinus]|nr:Uncharacterised protein [Xylophilus ampelinus]
MSTICPYAVVSTAPTVPVVAPKLTAVTGPPAAAPSAPSRSMPAPAVTTLPVAVSCAASSVTLLVSGCACGTSSTMRTVSVPVLVTPAASTTCSAIASVLSLAPGCDSGAFSVYVYASVPPVGTPPTVALAVKPVSTSVPSPVSMLTGVVPRADSCAGVSVVPPTVTLCRPSAALTVMLPLVRSDVSGPPAPSTRPASRTSAWPVAAPLPSTGTMPGVPSVRPWMVMVRVLVEVSPSASVMV